jgi:uncharacterized protein (TIGR02246 family)
MKGIPRLRATMTGMLLLVATASAHAQDDRRAAIEAADARFSAAVSKGDSAALAALYSADAQLMPERSEPIKGRDAIQKFMQQNIIDAGVAGANLKTLEVFGTGPTATEVGEYDMRDKSGAVLDHGKYMVVWRKAKGAWQIHRDMFSTNMAPKSKSPGS